MTILIITLVVIANVLGSAMAYPQAAKLLRTGDPEGVSAVWAGVSISMNVWWLVYGVANGLWGLVPTSAIATALYLVIAVAFVRSVGREAFGGLAGGAVVFGLAPLPVLLTSGWEAAGLTIGLCYGLQLAPAVIAAWRTRTLTGVASGTWLMAWLEGAIWAIYGVVVLDAALLTGGIAGVVMSSLVLLRLSITGHRPFRIARNVPVAAAM